jgi:hypothetical protein
MAKVLVLGETSGKVRDAFRALGHDAISADVLPTKVPGPHYEGDGRDLLKGDHHWDLVIAHPPCTYLCNSGVWALSAKNPDGSLRYPNRQKQMEEGAKFFKEILETPYADRVAVENPIMHRYASSLIGAKQSQIIHPWQHGHNESKATGLWLRNLPNITPTNIIPKPATGYRDNQTPTGQNKLGPSKNRWDKRSETYDGIAKAMAEQWHEHLPPLEKKMKFSRRIDGSVKIVY